MAEVGPRRSGPDSPRDLWAYIDARDAAAAFVAALTAPLAGHLRLFLSAADTYSETPSVELARAYPRAELRRPLPGHAAVIDITAARAAIGFAPRHSWRGYPAAA